MRIEDGKVIFKASDEFYDVEKRGLKPYTVRLMTLEDADRVLMYNVSRIVIVHATMPGVYFERIIRSKFILSVILGHLLVGIAWRHEGEKE